MRKFTVVLCVCIALVCINLNAVSWSDDSDVVEVRTDEKAGERRNIPVSAALVLPDASDSGRSAAEIAASVSGVRVKRNSGGEQIMVRGAGANQTPIYVDGVLCDSITLASLRGDEIERIEVYKGFTPGDLSTPGIGGAINIITKKAHLNSTEAGYTYRTGGYENFVRSSAGTPGLRNSFSLFSVHNRGDFQYTNDNGTPALNRDDDYTDTRRNNSLTRITFSDRLDFHKSAHSLWAAITCHSSEQGLPGTGTVQALNTKKNTSGFHAEGGYGYSGSHVALKSRALVKQVSADTRDPDLEMLSVTVDTRELRTISVSQNIGVTLNLLSLSVNASCDDECYEKTEYRSKDAEIPYPAQNRTLWHGAADFSLGLFSDRVRLIAQLRSSLERAAFYDEFSWTASSSPQRDLTNTPAWGAHSAVMCRIVPGVFNVKAGGGRSYRIADPSEVYGSAGFVQSNTSLKPEYVNRAEFGAEYFLRKPDVNIAVSALGFVSHAEDVILFVQNSQRTLKAFNISAAQIHGAEINSELTVFRFAGTGCAYTWQVARDRGQIEYYRDRMLPHRPEHEISAYAKIFNDNAQLRYTVDAVSFCFLDRANTPSNYRPSSLTHSLDASYLSGSFTVAAACRNITDVKRRDALGYPLEGRTLMCSARVRY